MTPRATYRLQLTPERGFDAAADVVDYAADLGVSHLYLSPVLQAVPGSAHGYDVVDPTRLDADRGGEPAFDRLRDACSRRGLGQVVDIVPNHLALDAEHNPWWRDVLRNGPASAHAGAFDLDWHGDPPAVLLPVLQQPPAAAVAAADVRLAAVGDGVAIVHDDTPLPVRDGSLAAAGLPADDPRAAVDAAARDPDLLLRLLDGQHYRLAHWRVADDALDHRRFFDVTSLGGVRVEDPGVFDATHAQVLDLVSDGTVGGLRVDHPDGLRDPSGYLHRLRAAAPGAWIVVEKILEPDERLREWPVDGTVGYDFCRLVLGLFVDPAGEQPLNDLYTAFTGREVDFAQVAHTAKVAVAERLFGPEVGRLAGLLAGAAADTTAAEASRADLRDAVVALLAAFPVYRTYVRAGDGRVDESDAAPVHRAVAAARDRRADLAAVLDLAADCLLLRVEGPEAAEFAMRFQQASGPVMGKGVEDTAFYRHVRLVALNEVGGDPSLFGTTVAAFHAANADRQRNRPAAMLTTSTHDTKRSEDVRARLAVLSEIPGRWGERVRRWSRMADPHRHGTGPERGDEYLLYQTLVGSWPIGTERVQAYMRKAVREAKLATSWRDPDPAYEDAVAALVAGVLDDDDLRAGLEAFASEVTVPGRVNSLAQCLLKLTSPGVPDVYQGCDLWDLSLVDPDNRRPVDFARRRALLADLGDRPPGGGLADDADGRAKLWLIRQALRLRASRPAAFGPSGDYTPLHATGRHADRVVAFVRGGEVVTAVPRLRHGAGWDHTALPLPAGRWHDVLGGARHAGIADVADLFADFPVALLAREAA